MPLSLSSNTNEKFKASAAAVTPEITERPILFQGDMVRAILAEVKTETRRVCGGSINTIHVPGPVVSPGQTVSPGQPLKSYANWALSALRKFSPATGVATFDIQCDVDDTRTEKTACPYGKVGERLWVRETWWEDSRDKGSEYQHIAYDATPNLFKNKDGDKYIKASVLGGELVSAEDSLRNLSTHPSWSRRPAIFMPRWASRLLLEITDVRVERLHEIDSRGATDEGIMHLPPEWVAKQFPSYAQARAKYEIDCFESALAESGAVPLPPLGPTRVQRYTSLWDSINGKKPGATWGDNPYVWVVCFRRVATNGNGCNESEVQS